LTATFAGTSIGRMTRDGVFINRIGRAVPLHDVHRKFTEVAPHYLSAERDRKLFRRMAGRCQIERRYSCLEPSSNPHEIVADGFYRFGPFPGTAERMARYEREALPLALRAVADLDLGDSSDSNGITHLIVASCTGLAAPGLDLQLAEALRLPGTVERTMVGFMGCAAALPALKLARHIVRSEERARVLVMALELCTLHFQESCDLERVLSFLLFGDGCAAALVTAEPSGVEIGGFAAHLVPDTADDLTWRIGSHGFEMHLSGHVPCAIERSLPTALPDILGGADPTEIRLWAVHPGGRTILDAVERGLRAAPDALTFSRRVLSDYGNMSSATVLFVLRLMMDARASGPGCAMAFGPGLAIEAMRFVLR
jgi:predicted naringenin-chalcone synthase